MADYRIELSRRAARDLRKLDAQGRARIDRALRGEARRLGSGRRERGGKRVKRLRGQRDEFLRLRVGSYRIIYEARRAEQVLLVLDIVHRRDLERRLRRD
jgi:mRNA interferase RelE/StbE